MRDFRFGWCGSKPKFRVHLVRADQRPLCELDKSDSWPGFTSFSHTMPEGRRLCKMCNDISRRGGRQRKRSTSWVTPAGNVRTDTTFKPVRRERTDFSDKNIYDESIPPWEEKQVVVGTWRPKETGDAL